MRLLREIEYILLMLDVLYIIWAERVDEIKSWEVSCGRFPSFILAVGSMRPRFDNAR